VRKLLLVKHAVPDIVPTLPAHAWHLSADGQRRCLLLARLLAPYCPATIVSSREPKAAETAAHVATHLHTSWRLGEGLHEHNRAHVGYLTREHFDHAVAAFFSHPDELCFGQETAHQARVRFHTAIDTLLCDTSAGNLIVITHGTVITLFVAHHTGLPAFPLWQRLGLPSFVVLTLPEFGLVEIVEDIGSSSQHC
jgi:broad specificity phosphatase PhoE